MLKQVIRFFLLGLIISLHTGRAHADEPTNILPTKNQLRYQNNQLGAFVHYGPAAYLNNGGGDYLTVPAPDLFNPVKLNTDQWMRAAKAIGAKHIVLTAKHHNGYCLWPTETSDFSVESSAWKNGKGDVVREFVDSARKHGLSPGLYLSSGDAYHGCKSTPDQLGKRKIIGDPEKYFPIFMQQLTELLTNYGELEVIWFDGAFNPFDPDVMDASAKPINGKYVDRIRDAVRRMQPNAVVMGGGWPDVRWAGSEQGKAPYPLNNVVQLGTGRVNWLPEYSQGWFVPESNIHTRQHWFWSPDTDKTLKSPERMMEAYDSSVALGANLLVNMTPDTDGLIPEAELKMLKTFGKDLKKRFVKRKGWVSNSEVGTVNNQLMLVFKKPTTINDIVIEEDLQFGQHIVTYTIEAKVDGQWMNIGEGKTIGRKRIHTVDIENTKSLRLSIDENTLEPRIKSFSAY
jgi:alpha-L-fucosidase